MTETNGHKPELSKDIVEKVSRELDPVVRIDENRLEAKCQCGGAIFFTILTKNQKLSMGAKIVCLVCVSCKRVHTVSDRGNMGEANTYQDADGRNHHILKAETGYLGMAVQRNNGNGS